MNIQWYKLPYRETESFSKMTFLYMLLRLDTGNISLDINLIIIIDMLL